MAQCEKISTHENIKSAHQGRYIKIATYPTGVKFNNQTFICL